MVMSRIYSRLLSTWMLAGSMVVAIAWFLDQALGGTTANPGQRPHVGVAVYAARLGLAPVVSAIGLGLGAWLHRERRHSAAAAILTTSLVVIVFAARPFAAVDLIGWREATFEAAVAGRTIATTALALVFAIVLYRERLISRTTLFAVGLGFPVLIGASRIELGVYPAPVVAAQWLLGALIAGGLIWAYSLSRTAVEQR